MFIKSYTCFSSGDEAPIDHSRLHSTEEVQEEYSTWKAFILENNS